MTQTELTARVITNAQLRQDIAARSYQELLDPQNWRGHELCAFKRAMELNGWNTEMDMEQDTGIDENILIDCAKGNLPPRLVDAEAIASALKISIVELVLIIRNKEILVNEADRCD